MRFFFFLFTSFFLYASSFAQMSESPVQWSWETEAVTEDIYLLKFRADIEEGWTLYSQFTSPDDGPVPTNFEFTPGDHYELIGQAEEKGKIKEGLDPVFGVNVVKFTEGPAYFTQKVKVSDIRKAISGYLTFMCCDDEQCLPPTDVDFSFSLSENATSANNTVALADYPLSDIDIDKSNSDAACGVSTVSVEESSSLGWIFIAGFIGGLLALLTPCVFPMIPLTVGFFTKSSVNRASGIRNATIYGLSIIVIYVLLGMLVTGVFGADALNRLSTNAIFNIFFAVLFIVFALSFFGLFEITLPSSWANKTEIMSDKGGLLGIFFMAFTLSLVSFSCTGPIIGTLLVETATGGGAAIFGRIPVGPLVGMLGFSVALALPFALFAAFPSWLNSLPKSGGWMSDVKVTLGFVELALALKFLSVADLTEGWKILPYELFLTIWVVCALGISAYFLGLLKFPVNYTKPKRTPTKSVLSVLFLGIAVYLAAGFRYSDVAKTFQTPLLVSGIAPPAGHSYIYPNDCPLNLECYKDLEEGMVKAKESGKPILLDFTGHGCVNCRKMEDNVWGETGVYELIRDDYILVSLYVDDRKPLEQPYASPIDGSTRRTVGNKWADFQLLQFGKQSQPYYVLMSSDGKVLNTPVPNTPDKEKYQKFLECGLQQFKQTQQLGEK
ncbi:MAG: cytochrome c biogenesis protein CcdA [Bacteroidota bacterium]